MNFIIKDGKKYARICHGNFSDQLVLVDPNFRVIIIVEKDFIDEVESPFLSRFEKHIVSFDKLIDNKQNELSEIILKDDLNLKYILRNLENTLNPNYILKDLLISCKKYEILGLIYNTYIEYNIDNNEKDIKNLQENIKIKVIKKIAKLLPQDILINLPEENVLRKTYNQVKKFYNLNDYIDSLNNDEKYNISIIYTFSSITNTTNKLISEFKSENNLINYINGIINTNKSSKNKNDIIYIDFEHSNSKYLNFVITSIEKYYFNKEKANGDNIKFIFTIHLKRHFKIDDDRKFGRIYSIPDVYSDINQIFIDNLKGQKIQLDKILERPIKDFLKDEEIDINKEFMKILRKYFNDNLETLYGKDKNIDENNYIQKMEKYFENDYVFMTDIIDKAKSYIEDKGNNLIEKIFKNNYISKTSIDMTTILIEFIRDKILSKYIIDILNVFEDNNFLTSLIVINENQKLSYDIIKKIKKIYLDNIQIDKNKKYSPKFMLNYQIPGFYNFYCELSNFISNNIFSEYMRNEKKLREFLKGDEGEAKKTFDNKESVLLSSVYQEVKKNEFIFNFIEMIPKDLLLDDYITFYLTKYHSDKSENISLYFDDFLVEDFVIDDLNHKLINKLLNLRFDENQKFKNNDDIKKLLIKIIWIESNINYISKILKIYSLLKNIFRTGEEFYDFNEENKSDEKLYELMEKTLKEEGLRYVTNEDKNPIITTEVNECYYLLLASMCYSIIPPNVNLKNVELYYYFDYLKSALKIMQNLNDDLYIFLNEMYIIDEFIKIYDILDLNNKSNIESLIEISNNLKKNNDIIQLNEDNDECDALKEVFNDLYKLIKNLLNYEDKGYYDLLKYIFYKEIKKIPNINYRTDIFEKLVKENELIINSNDILQLLLKTIVNPSKENFIKSVNKILNEKSEIILLMENILNSPNDNNYFILSETLLYFFEKNSMIYLNKVLNDKKESILLENEKETLKIFKECYFFLQNYYQRPNRVVDKNKNICKLFCIAYIKIYCYTFINFINTSNTKLKDPLKIINEINKDDSIRKTIILYIYKVIYNRNRKNIDIFITPEYIQKYKLKEYNGFDKFFINPEDNPFTYKYINPRAENIKNYEPFYEKLEKYKSDKFEKININDFNLKSLGIDIFYFSTSNLILSCLKFKEFNESPIYINFYKNVCIPLFKAHNKIYSAIQLFYNPSIFEKIKEEFNIDSEAINILFYSYRYCLNELYSSSSNSIYGFLYNKKTIENINKYYYPGNDINDNPIYEIYSKVEEHFEKKPNQGCYVCLCQKGYYHCIPGGNPSEKNLNMNCKNCNEPIGSIINERHYIVPVKRDKYFRIFKTKGECEKAKRLRGYKANSMTILELKEQFIKKYFIAEKGIAKVNRNHFIKDTKIIRNLSQVAYRLLNFILYSHLFFARLYTENRRFDTFLPENMSWIEVIKECWELLKIELSKQGISVIDIFMNYVFFDLFSVLNEQNSINDYESLITLEKNLNEIIKKKIADFKSDYKSFDKIKKSNNNNKFNSINLLEERFHDYKDSEYPFYNCFYYSDYINEEYLLEKLKHIENNKYPVLLKVLEYNISSNNNILYSLNHLKTFNEVLNLFNEKYSHSIIREKANKITLEEDDLYKDKETKNLIDEFIKFYNNLKLKNDEKMLLKLSKESKLSEFFIDENTDIGKSYKIIYNEFIKEQNSQITDLLDLKIEKGIFDKNCKKQINIQNANEDDIFLLNLPKKFSFVDVVFNCSHRKVIDNNDPNSYNQFEIDTELIEERMTDILLKNKKLFNYDINNFVYKNEDLFFENTNIITKFNKEYTTEEININDKIILFDFYNDNKENINLFTAIIKDFIKLIIYLNNNKESTKKEKLSAKFITEKTLIYKILDFPNDIKAIFNENNKSFTVSKLTNIFEYYIIVIFELIRNDLKNYQIEIGEDKIMEINKYFEGNNIITKEAFHSALGKFIALFLFQESDKENRIKNNINNIANYLNIPDIWEKKIFNKKEFSDELNKIKNVKIQINQILAIYELLGKEFNENYFEDVILQKKRKEEEIRKAEEEMKMPKKEEINQVEELKEEKQSVEKNDNIDDDEDDYYDRNDDSDEDVGGRD